MTYHKSMKKRSRWSSHVVDQLAEKKKFEKKDKKMKKYEIEFSYDQGETFYCEAETEHDAIDQLKKEFGDVSITRVDVIDEDEEV